MHLHPDLFFFSILPILILAIAGRIIYSRARKKPLSSRWTESIKHLGQISLATGVLMQMTELSRALGDITNALTTEVIAKGLMATLLSTILGLLAYILAMVLFTILKLTEKEELR